MTTEDDPMVVRELDKILPLAMRPTPSGARLDLRLYFHTERGKEGRWLSVAVTDADDNQIGAVAAHRQAGWHRAVLRCPGREGVRGRGG